MIDEALHYLGVKSDPEGVLRGRMAALLEETRARFRPRHVLRVLDVRQGNPVTVGDAALTAGLPLQAGLPLPGEMARRMLWECRQAALLVCTMGADFEARLRAEQARGMARAVMLDALGSAMVEEACDEAEKELAARFPGMYLTDRFSPGYGDLPLSVQPDILAATDAARRLGVQATESCLLLPQKTVTAVIGIADRRQPARVRGCARCAMRETCEYREGGTTCAI